MNKNEAQKLLAGLPNVTIQNIDSYLQKQGIIVDVHIGRIRGTFNASPKTFGVDPGKSDNLKNFFNNYVHSGQINFIPEEPFGKRLRSIESLIRQKKCKYAIGYDNKFMSINSFEEFSKFFEEKKKEYFDVLNEILDKWEFIIKDFKDSFSKSLDEMNSIEAETYKAEVFRRLPSKEAFKQSFYMDLSLKAFPAVANLNLFNDSIDEKVKEGIIEDNMKVIYTLLSNVCQDCFEVINKILIDYKLNTRITPSRFSKITELIKRLKQNNLLKNNLINNIINNLSSIDSAMEDEDIIDKCDEIIGQLYTFTKDIGIIDDIPFNECPISNETLENMYSICAS